MKDKKTSLLSDQSDAIYEPGNSTAIKVSNVVLDYNFANQKLNNLKEYFITIAKRQLMFKRFRALDNVSLEVQSGDVFGILGTNGSGKSTLLKVVSGVLEPTEGSVEITGNIAPLIEMGAGFDYELTARENIYLNGSLLGYSQHFIDQHFDEIVEFAEIEEFLDLPLKNYSSGMVSRIAFAIATIIVPDILVVDEVLSVGDQMFQRKCEKRIQELIREHGTTVLIVSHSSDLIDRLCNKAIWIEKGKTRMVGTAKDVSTAYQALGGHKGTEQAELDLFEILQTDSPDVIDDVSFFIGDTSYVVNDLINTKLKAIDNSIDTAVLIKSNDVNLQMMAMSLASKPGSMLFKVTDEGVDKTTLTFLKDQKIETVKIVKRSEFNDQIIDEINLVCRPRTIEEYDGADIFELCKNIYTSQSRVLTKRDTAVFITGAASVPAMTSFQYAFDNQMPVFIADEDKEIYSRAFNEVASLGFSNIICFYKSQITLDDLKNLAEPFGTKIIDFMDNSEQNSIEVSTM